MTVFNMTVSDETLCLVKGRVMEENVGCKVIIAPSLVGVYVNDNKDVLMQSTAISHHWKFQHRGLLALVYHPALDRLKLMVVDEKSGRMQWMETLGDYTNYVGIHDVFHILNSSKNFCQKIGLYYEEEKVARMIAETLQILNALRRREARRGGKIIARSKSFNSTERAHIKVKLQRSFSNSMGNIKTHHTTLNIFEREAKKYTGKSTTRRPSLRKMFNGLRSSFRVRIRRQDSIDADISNSKRKRMSSCSTTDDKGSSLECSPSNIATIKDASMQIFDETFGDSLNNWKLTEDELQELYRRSFFKERNEQSTDLCITEL